MPTPLLLLALLGAAQAEDQPPDATKLRLKIAQRVISTGLIEAERADLPPSQGQGSLRYTSAALSSGPTRVELTHRLRPRFELGGAADLGLVRLGGPEVEGGPYTNLSAGLGLTAVHTTPLRPGAVLYGQAAAGYRWSTAESNVPDGGTRTHALNGWAAVGLRLRLAPQLTLEPALTGGTGRAWTPAAAASDPAIQDSRGTALWGGAELGLSYRF